MFGQGCTTSKKQTHLETVNQAFEKKLQEDPVFRENLVKEISSTLEKGGLVDSPIKVVTKNSPSLEILAAAEGQVITAQAFWWGYHFVIPEAAMKDFTSGGSVVAAFMALGGTIIAASGGALAPLVAVVAAYVAVELPLMLAIDQGKGVYLSAVWLTWAVLVPTAIVD